MTVSRTPLAQGYTISRIVKGGWQLAGGHGPISRDAALADMEAFVGAGITTFDCADIYTGVEELIGAYLGEARNRGGREAADRVQVHTKCVPDLHRLSSLTEGDVARMVDRSLLRLGVDVLDLVQLHWWDYRVPGYVEMAAALDRQRRAGKIRHIGLTNFDQPRLGEIVDAGVPVVSHQVQYSVLDRRPAGEMAAGCHARGIGFLTYGALAGGFLSERWLGKTDPGSVPENRSLVKYRLIIEEFGGWVLFQDMLSVLELVARRHGVAIGAVAVRWVLDRPGVAGVIVGARHRGHLASIVSADSLVLDDRDRADILRVQAGARGPAGDVYALEREPGGRHAGIMRYNLQQA